MQMPPAPNIAICAYPVQKWGLSTKKPSKYTEHDSPQGAGDQEGDNYQQSFMVMCDMLQKEKVFERPGRSTAGEPK
jgi:hypothetical protein